MKIVSWNCRGAFRDKFKKVSNFDADIYVISEAENPEKYVEEQQCSEYMNFIHNYLWLGNGDDKGILIFHKDDVKLEDNLWNSKHEYFLSVHVTNSFNNSFDLVAVWTQKNEKLKLKYVEEVIPFLRIYEDKIRKSDKILFCGDFNSNKIWDNEHKGKSHTDMVKLFNSMNLHSIYHELNNEEQGEETTPTFFEYLHEDKPFHIDYVFSTPNLVKTLKIGTYNDYVGCDEPRSDHVPLIFEVDI